MREILAQIAEVQTGPFGSQLHAADYVGQGTPIITVEHIGLDGRIRHESVPQVGRADRDRLARFALDEGDLVFSRVGAIDRCARVSEAEQGWLFSGRLLRVRPRADQVDSRFLRAFLSHETSRRWIKNHAVGSTMACLNTTILENVPVALPPLGKQRRVAEILDAADESIRSTERLIDKLERTQEGLSLNLLTDNHGWEYARLRELLTEKPRNGYSPKEAESYTGTLMLGLGCLTPRGFEPRQLKYGPVFDPRIERALLSDGDLLMSRANTRELVGMVGRFQDVGTRCIYPDLMMRLRPNALVRADFLELLLRSPFVRRQIQAHAVGTSESMVKISSATVLRLEMKIPSLAEQDLILSALSSSNMQLHAVRQKLGKLRKLKQGLMDDLLTGKVRLRIGEDVTA